jgi:hypothetical protein
MVILCKIKFISLVTYAVKCKSLCKETGTFLWLKINVQVSIERLKENFHEFKILLYQFTPGKHSLCK